jgi:hypothetical protein
MIVPSVSRGESFMHMVLNAGEALRVDFGAMQPDGEIAVTLSTISGPAKRGPKSLPKSDAKASDFHAPILKALTRKPLTANQIRERIGGTPETKNTISWALVELQNEGSRRGKNLPKTGPLVKNDDGTYSLRATK